jgi:hypothetical protein
METGLRVCPAESFSSCLSYPSEGLSMSVTRVIPFVVISLTAPLAASRAETPGLEPTQHAMHAPDLPPGLVEKVREATAQFREQPPPGYDQFLGCVSGPQEGAMGIHFVNMTLVDANPEVDKPEALIYEPRNGELRLVGVEYIVPAALWDTHNPHPPVLEGQSFQFIDKPNRYGLDPIYELHVWAWRDNPHGAFVDWNTRVSCEGQ